MKPLHNLFCIQATKLNRSVAACYRLANKAADAGGLTSCFLAEAQRTQRKMNTVILSMQKTYVTSAFPAPLRE